MKKRTAALAAMLAAVLLLCSCDTQAAYENLLHRLGGEPDAQPAAQTETEQTTQTETPAPVTATPNSALWPDGVPAPAACNTILFESRLSDTNFTGEYLVTNAQYAAWTTKLAAAGLTPTAAGFTSADWALTVTKVAQSGTSDSDWRVTVVAKSTAPVWDKDFTAFPLYSGDGTYTLVRSTEETKLLKSMTLTAKNETKDGLARYIALLETNGFVNVGYGMYSKSADGALCEVATDGAWQADGTVVLTYNIISSK